MECILQELQAIFEVIGTPEWTCVENVENKRWRRYLARLPAKAPAFMRRFGFAGEVALDVLRRLLAFDPRRRCSAEELLHHEYFCGITPLEEADLARISSDTLRLRPSWVGQEVKQSPGAQSPTIKRPRRGTASQDLPTACEPVSLPIGAF